MILLYLFKIGHVLHDCYDKLVGKYYSIKISAFTEVKDSVKVEGRMFFYKAKGAYVQIGKQLRIINSAKVNSLCTRISSIVVFLYYLPKVTDGSFIFDKRERKN